jgi:predicted RNA-binding protein associated with RNAse of E/G family
MVDTIYWAPGDPIVFRAVWHSILWWSLPVIVVQDTPDLTAIYWSAGTHGRAPNRRTTPQDLLAGVGLKLEDYTWTRTDVLMLAVPGEAHSVYAMWENEHTRLNCWYVNLEEPLRRTPIGFDTMDHLLDVVISPDRSAWRWKDEDEFAEAVALGIFSAEQASAIRAEGEKVIRQMQAGEPPFCSGWEAWKPPMDWVKPELPTGWERLNL